MTCIKKNERIDSEMMSVEENITCKKYSPESVKSGCIRTKLLPRKHFVFKVTASLIS